MKKILTLLFLAAFMISCEGPEGPMGPPGPEGPEGGAGEGMEWYVAEVPIPKGDWKRDPASTNQLQIYTADVTLKDLLQEEDLPAYIYEVGKTLGYVYFNYNSNNEKQSILPYEKKEVDKNNHMTTERYSMIYFHEVFTLRVEYVGFDVEKRPEDMNFRIVLNW